MTAGRWQVRESPAAEGGGRGRGNTGAGILVIYAKTPRLGTVKTRLGREIGMVEAWRFYRTNLDAVLRRLGRDSRWKTVVAETPDASGFPWPVPVIPQGPGDLGDRMDRTMRSLPPGPVVIIGTDVPAIMPAHIAEAFRRLRDHDAVFGPAVDGGYWLVGLRRRPRVPGIFDGVRWSSEHALADTLGNLGGCSIARLAVLEDVDNASSWWRWRR